MKFGDILKENTSFSVSAHRDNAKMRENNIHLHNNTLYHITKHLGRHNRGLSSYDDAKTRLDQIRKYTSYNDDTEVSYSTNMNKRLISGSKLGKHQQAVHDVVKSSALPAGKDVNLYSGIGRKFAEKLSGVSEGDTLHSPAHISASLGSQTARSFAAMHGAHTDGKLHIMKFSIKPHDKVLHIGEYSHVPDEYETIIPSGATLKYHGYEDHMPSEDDVNGVHRATHRYSIRVHHVSIHSQE